MTCVYLSGQTGAHDSENSYSGQSIIQLIETEDLDALNSERGGYLDRSL